MGLVFQRVFQVLNNTKSFGSGIGNIASKAASATSSALGSQTAQTAIKTTGTVAAAVLTNGTVYKLKDVQHNLYLKLKLVVQKRILLEK